MATFADLGIPFPLFEAPTHEASGYAGLATCRLCKRGDRHCFELGVGDALILPCPACGAENGLPADDRGDVPCRSCGGLIVFPESLVAKKQLLACYDCLRAGKGAITQGTEFGVVSWEQAFEGVTNGVPGLRTEQFEVVAIDPAEDWSGARIPSVHLWELLRTPGFHSWQDERWLFCCSRPMAYLGGWRNAMESLRPDDPDAFYQALFAPEDEARSWGYEEFDEGSSSLYVYRCLACGRCRATYDWD
ncbi:CbrC family protein [Paludisphaera soli]|uniref:CbrC family protein n=1 Tax=Paludisphaera soli TaxID=2712865 RepID=UPI0013EB5EFC|nr:CbrC family protein [Paludisphaera soli]